MSRIYTFCRLLVIGVMFITVVAAVAQEVTPEATPEEAVEAVPEVTAESTADFVVADDRIADTIQADFEASTQAPLIGEPFELSLVVELPPEAELVEWPQFGEFWGPFNILDSGELESEPLDNGGTRYTQMFETRIWRTGDFETPQTFVRYQVPGVDQVYGAPVLSLFFSVPSVLETQNLNDLVMKPYTPPYRVLYIPPWLVVAGIAAVGVGMWGAWRWYQWWYPRWIASRRVEIIMTPEEKAVQALATIANSNLPADIVFMQSADVLRDYVEAHFGLDAEEMTTEELQTALSSESVWHQTLGRNEQIDSLIRILEQADLVKFAEIEPNQRSAERVVQMAIRWVENMSSSEGTLVTE